MTSRHQKPGRNDMDEYLPIACREADEQRHAAATGAAASPADLEAACRRARDDPAPVTGRARITVTLAITQARRDLDRYRGEAARAASDARAGLDALDMQLAARDYRRLTTPAAFGDIEAAGTRLAGAARHLQTLEDLAAGLGLAVPQHPAPPPGTPAPPPGTYAFTACCEQVTGTLADYARHWEASGDPDATMSEHVTDRYGTRHRVEITMDGNGPGGTRYRLAANGETAYATVAR